MGGRVPAGSEGLFVGGEVLWGGHLSVGPFCGDTLATVCLLI